MKCVRGKWEIHTELWSVNVRRRDCQGDISIEETVLGLISEM